MAVVLCAACALGGFAPAVAAASLAASPVAPSHDDQIEVVRHDVAQCPVTSLARAPHRRLRALTAAVRNAADTIRRLGSRAPGAPAAWRGPPVLLI